MAAQQRDNNEEIIDISPIQWGFLINTALTAFFFIQDSEIFFFFFPGFLIYAVLFIVINTTLKFFRSPTPSFIFELISLAMLTGFNLFCIVKTIRF